MEPLKDCLVLFSDKLWIQPKFYKVIMNISIVNNHVTFQLFQELSQDGIRFQPEKNTRVSFACCLLTTQYRTKIK